MRKLYTQASWYHIFTNTWQRSFIWRVYRNKQVDQADLFAMRQQDDASLLSGRLASQWAKQESKPNGSLLSAVLRIFLSKYLVCVLMGIACQALAIGALVLIKYFIDFLVSNTSSLSAGVTLFSSLLLLLLGSLFLNHLAYFHYSLLRITLRKALIGLLYGKLLKLPHRSVTSTTAGQLISLSSGDLNNLERGRGDLPNLLVSPVVSFITLAVIYFLIGPPVFCIALISLFTFILLVPLSSLLYNLRTKASRLTDSRLSTMSTFLQGIFTLKSHAWEGALVDSALQKRQFQYRALKGILLLNGLNFGVFRNVKLLMQLVTMSLLLSGSQPLVASTIFSVFELIQFYSFVGIQLFSESTNSAAQFISLLRRMEQILRLEEVESLPIESGQANRLELIEVRASWSHSSELKSASNSQESQEDQENESLLPRNIVGTEAVKGVNFSLKDGNLTGVVGRVGSGKSSLLATILGQTKLLGGQMAVNGNCAYVEQEPCLLVDSLRSNITFGLGLDQERLRKMIEVCHLSKDIEAFPRGLDSIIGERGITLSGGQRARISLARACYSQADIYLLDDPLSAVDPEIAQGLFRDCLRGYLREKAVLLVSHQTRFFSEADAIIVLEEGEQVFRGDYKALQQNQFSILEENR